MMEQPLDDTALCGRILIVDDDPVAAGMLGVSLGAAGHEIIEVYSGEEALARLAETNHEPLPDLVILDIEMAPGIDGYETCRQLRAIEATRELPVIFVSGHDELDDRLRAYDAGGSDFMAKPFVPDELLRKAALSISHKRRQESAAMDKKIASDTAMTALTSMGEAGLTLRFNRSALGCQTLKALAELMIESMSDFEVDCHVQLRVPTQILTWTRQGPASPLEESVIEKMRTMERLFSFGKRLIINFDSISLLVTNMPVADDHLCGRIRDHAAMVAEAAELAASNINLRTEANMRANEMRQLSSTSREAVEKLRNSYRELHVATRVELEYMAHSIEGLYVHLGLSNSQEFTISDTVRGSVGQVLSLFEQTTELDQIIAGVLEDLTKASAYSIAQDDDAPPMIELW